MGCFPRSFTWNIFFYYWRVLSILANLVLHFTSFRRIESRAFLRFYFCIINLPPPLDEDWTSSDLWLIAVLYHFCHDNICHIRLIHSVPEPDRLEVLKALDPIYLRQPTLLIDLTTLIGSPNWVWEWPCFGIRHSPFLILLLSSIWHIRWRYNERMHHGLRYSRRLPHSWYYP